MLLLKIFSHLLFTKTDDNLKEIEQNEIEYIEMLIQRKSNFHEIFQKNIYLLCKHYNSIHKINEEVINKENRGNLRETICRVYYACKKFLLKSEPVIEDFNILLCEGLDDKNRKIYEKSVIFNKFLSTYKEIKVKNVLLKNITKEFFRTKSSSGIKNISQLYDTIFDYAITANKLVKDLISIDIFLRYTKNLERYQHNRLKSSIILDFKLVYNEVTNLENGLAKINDENKFKVINNTNIHARFENIIVGEYTNNMIDVFNLQFTKIIFRKIFQNKEFKKVINFIDCEYRDVLKYFSNINEMNDSFFKGHPKIVLEFFEFIVEEKLQYDFESLEQYLNIKEMIDSFLKEKIENVLNILIGKYFKYFNDIEVIEKELEYFYNLLYNYITELKNIYYSILSNDFIIEEFFLKYFEISENKMNEDQKMKLLELIKILKLINIFEKDSCLYNEISINSHNLEAKIMSYILTH